MKSFSLSFSEAELEQFINEGRLIRIRDLIRDMEIDMAIQILAEEAMDPEFKTYKGYRGCTVKFGAKVLSSV